MASKLQTISKEQPMREGEISVIDYLNGDLTDYLKEKSNDIDTLEVEIKGVESDVNKFVADFNTKFDSETKARTDADSTLQTNIDTVSTNLATETTRATQVETSLNQRYDTLNNKFPVATENIKDKAVTDAKLSSDIQTLLSFCKTLPDFEYGYSDSLSILANGSTSFNITFASTKTETPQLIVSAQCNSTVNITTKVRYVTTTTATVDVYNNSATSVENVTVDWFAISGR